MKSLRESKKMFREIGGKKNAPEMINCLVVASNDINEEALHELNKLVLYLIKKKTKKNDKGT